MKKNFWKYPVITVALIIIALVIVVWVLIAPIASAYLTSKMHVPVSIGRIGISSSELTIANFKIRNPHSFHVRTAFSTKKIIVTYSWKQLWKSPTVIDQIDLNDVLLTIECKNPLCSENNWTAIAKKMQEKKQKTKGKGVLIKKLVFNNFNVELRGMGLITSTKKIRHFDRMEFDNINSNNGFPTKQLISKIFNSADIRGYLKNLLTPQGWLEDAFSPFRNLGVDAADLLPDDCREDDCELKKVREGIH